MEITVNLPDKLTEKIGEQWGDLSKKVVDSLALEAYKSKIISTAELGEILGFSSRLEIHDFLQKSGVYLNYDQEDLADDLETIKNLRDKCLRS
jgi:predicted HTH domain antitoxin